MKGKRKRAMRAKWKKKVFSSKGDKGKVCRESGIENVL